VSDGYHRIEHILWTYLKDRLAVEISSGEGAIKIGDEVVSALPGLEASLVHPTDKVTLSTPDHADALGGEGLVALDLLEVYVGQLSPPDPGVGRTLREDNLREFRNLYQEG
jgi:hypothetical protein